MTREEAIDILDDNFTVIDTHGHYTEEEECLAIDMAIEALDQLTSYEQTINKLTEAISNQAPKIGRWEWVQYDYNPKLGNWHCSECRCIVVECVDKEEKGGIPLYKYCPQCGAKMQEAEIEG